MKEIYDEIKIKSNNQLMVFRLGNELEYELYVEINNLETI